MSRSLAHRTELHPGVGPAPSSRSGPSRPGAATAIVPMPLELLIALGRCWQRALPLGLLLGAAVALAVWYLLPAPRQAVWARLEVAVQRPKIMFNIAEGSGEYGLYQRTQLALVRSKRVLRAALADPKVAVLPVVRSQADPVGWLDRELQADFANGSEILRIGLALAAPDQAMVLVNTIASIYLNEVGHKEQQQQKERYESLRALLSDLQAGLTEKRQQLRQLQESAGSGRTEVLSYLQQLAALKLSRADEELDRVRSELRRKRLEREQRPLATGPEPRLVSDAEHRLLLADPRYRELAQQVAQAETLVRRADRISRNRNDPAILSARKSLDQALLALAEYRRSLGDASQVQPGGLRPAGLAPAEEQAMLERLEQELVQEVQVQTEEVRNLNHRTLDLQAYQEQIEHAETVARKVGAEVAALEVEVHAPPRITMLDPAEAPRIQPDQLRARTAATAGLSTLGLVMLATAYTEFRSRRIGAPEDVPRCLGLNLIGSLPTLTRSLNGLPALESAENRGGYHRLADSIDAIRALILHGCHERPVQTLLVASALSGEGKTTVACHLAVSLARAGRRTLLIDADLRQPRVHRLFDLELSPGLCDRLRQTDSHEPDLAPRSIGVTDLWVLPAGQSDDSALRALGRGSLTAILDRFRAEFDMIVIDSGPILLVPDTLSLVPGCDGVVVSILRGVSRLPLVATARERLAAINAPILGAVVCGASDHDFRPYYGS